MSEFFDVVGIRLNLIISIIMVSLSAVFLFILIDVILFIKIIAIAASLFPLWIFSVVFLSMRKKYLNEYSPRIHDPEKSYVLVGEEGVKKINGILEEFVSWRSFKEYRETKKHIYLRPNNDLDGVVIFKASVDDELRELRSLIESKGVVNADWRVTERVKA